MLKLFVQHKNFAYASIFDNGLTTRNDHLKVAPGFIAEGILKWLKGEVLFLKLRKIFNTNRLFFHFNREIIVYYSMSG
jgi:hypothetical protein